MTIFCQSKDKSISPDIYLSVAPFWQWKLQLFESRAWAQAGHKTWKLPNVLHHPKMPRSNGTNWVPGHEVSTLHKPDFGVLVRLQDDLEAATNVPLVDSGHSDYLFESSRHPLLPRKNTYDLRGKCINALFWNKPARNIKASRRDCLIGPAPHPTPIVDLLEQEAGSVHDGLGQVDPAILLKNHQYSIETCQPCWQESWTHWWGLAQLKQHCYS